jgi:hypothetical protein
MVFSVKKYLDPLEIGNAIAVSTKEFDTKELYVIDAV